MRDWRGAAILEPDQVVANVCAIARELARRSRMSEEELVEALLEPFDIGFVEPDPSWPGVASGDDRATIRMCGAVGAYAHALRSER